MIVYFIQKEVININQLSEYVDSFISDKGIKKVWIAEQMGISQQLLYRLQNKKNFNVDDANRILSVIGYKIDYDIKPL